jgi:REP element-mobilizing transposase RayT
MPRAKRVEFDHAHYHAYDRGVRKSDLFRSDDDRRLFIKLFAETCLERSWKCLAYCLMSNHYHLLIRTDVAGLSAGMQAIKARYAEYLNREYEFSGHAFEGRFKAKPILDEAYLLEVLRYAVRNPVVAGMCERVEDWPWSSHAAMVGTRSHREWFDRSGSLALFSRDETRAVSAYVNFVANGKPQHELLSEREFTRNRRDAAIRAAYASGRVTMKDLMGTFPVSMATIRRALEGSDPL